MVSRENPINADNRLRTSTRGGRGACKKDCIENIDVADTFATPLFRKQRSNYRDRPLLTYAIRLECKTIDLLVRFYQIIDISSDTMKTGNLITVLKKYSRSF